MLLALAVRLVEEGVERHEGEDGVHAWAGLGLGLGLGLALGLGLGFGFGSGLASVMSFFSNSLSSRSSCTSTSLRRSVVFRSAW